MRIYIASSWRNQHAVEMLTDLLEHEGHEVASFVRFACETVGRGNLKFSGLDAWIASEDGARKFEYDIDGATSSDLVIYIGPSGMDAWAEVGAAFGRGKTIIGLWSKGEEIGLMRRLVDVWFRDYRELLAAVKEYSLDFSSPLKI